jgi:uncharacterized repeat protein (TIGR01451 family)
MEEAKKNSENQKYRLIDYQILIDGKRPDTPSEFEDWLEKNKNSILTEKEVKEIKNKYKGINITVERVKTELPGANIIKFIEELIQTIPYSKELKEWIKLHGLNESLNNTQYDREQAEKKIAEKWENLKEQFPEVANAQTREQFEEWEKTAKISDDQKKTLTEKNISLSSAWQYKKYYDIRHNIQYDDKQLEQFTIDWEKAAAAHPELKNIQTGNEFAKWQENHADISKRLWDQKNFAHEQKTINALRSTKNTPSLIFKLATKNYTPKSTERMSLSEQKNQQTPDEYMKKYNELPIATQKAIQRHEKKLAQKPPRSSSKFKKRYGYIKTLKFTPTEIALKKIAYQETKHAKKKTGKEQKSFNWNLESEKTYQAAWLAYLDQQLEKETSSPEPEPQSPDESESAATSDSHSSPNISDMRKAMPENSPGPATRETGRGIGNTARSLRTGQGAARAMGQAARAGAQAARQAALAAGRAIIFNPYVWIPLLILLLLIILYIIIFQTGNEEKNQNVLQLAKTGPDSAKNGDSLPYTITVTYPGTAQDIIITDHLPDGTKYIEAPEGKYDATTNTVTWNLASIIGSSSATPINNVNKDLKLTLEATKDNTVLANFASATLIGATTSSTSAATNNNTTAVNTNNCNSNPLINNFGDPQCTFTKEKLAQLIQQKDPQHIQEWFTIVKKESNYDPNYFSSHRINGVSNPVEGWGLFQMGISDPNDPYNQGDTDWETQTTNAINYNNTKLIPANQAFCYWESARESGIAKNCK